MQLNIPNADGTRQININKDEIHDHLLTQNQTHLQQANCTLFGQNGPLFHLVDPEGPNNSIDKMLQGNEIQWEDLMTS